MGKITHLERQIERCRAKLKIRYASKGSYENFGQREVRKLNEEFTTTDNHFDNMNNHKEIQKFNEWCMSYDG